MAPQQEFARFREGLLSTSQTVAQHLPYLRRYARALSGNQASGDAYVAAALETLVQDPKVLETGASTRIALYRLFTKIWNSVGINGQSGSGEAAQPVERHLAQIAPMPRQAFLLVALEGLSEDDAAKVLDVDEGSRGRLGYDYQLIEIDAHGAQVPQVLGALLGAAALPTSGRTVAIDA